MKQKRVQTHLGNQVPRRGNRLTEWLGVMILWLTGWRVVGDFPNTPKAVVIGAPHSSNWDALYVGAAVLALRVKVQIMAKDTAFKPPFGRFMRWLGGIPINRKSSHGVVQQTVSQIRNNQQLFMALSPEGTRSGAKEWKSGFYVIAQAAKVPILVTVIDYGKKEIRFADTITPSGNFEADYAKILELYRGAEARRPELMSAPLKKLREPALSTSMRNTTEE